jgi:hypothetical protein
MPVAKDKGFENSIGVQNWNFCIQQDNTLAKSHVSSYCSGGTGYSIESAEAPWGMVMEVEDTQFFQKWVFSRAACR